nr:MAG TPA: Membrane-associated protein [Caudoviricetes sp.]
MIIILTCREGRGKSLQPWLSGTARLVKFLHPRN